MVEVEDAETPNYFPYLATAKEYFRINDVTNCEFFLTEKLPPEISEE